MAQVMFDQFIAAGRAKWGQKSGLVMLLPHALKGKDQSIQVLVWNVSSISCGKQLDSCKSSSSAATISIFLRRQAKMLEKMNPSTCSYESEKYVTESSDGFCT